MHKSWKYAHRWSLLPNIILYCQHLTRKCCTLEKYAQISSQPHQKGQLWAHKWGGSIDLILINSVIDQYFWPFYFTFKLKSIPRFRFLQYISQNNQILCNFNINFTYNGGGVICTNLSILCMYHVYPDDIFHLLPGFLLY